MNKLGPLQKKALEFIRMVNGWHTYASDKQTKGVISRLEKRGLIETNEFKQFRKKWFDLAPLTLYLTSMNKIETALQKFPKARRIAVENFTIGLEGKGMDFATAMNLDADARAYGWKTDTIKAIKFVLAK